MFLERRIFFFFLIFIFTLSFLGVSFSEERETSEAITTKVGHISGEVFTKPIKYKKDVVIYLKSIAGTFEPTTTVEAMDQKDLVFIPHVLPILQGTTVNFLNSDNVRHNVFSPDGEKYNLGTWPKGKVRSYTFKNLGVYTQLCNVHPEMEAYIVVLQNPYFAVTDREGKYFIKNVPIGKYVWKTWSEKMKSQEIEVVVDMGKITTVNFSLKK